MRGRGDGSGGCNCACNMPLFSASQVDTVLKAVILPGNFSIQLGVLYMIHPKFHHSRTILVAANF